MTVFGYVTVKNVDNRPQAASKGVELARCTGSFRGYELIKVGEINRDNECVLTFQKVEQ